MDTIMLSTYQRIVTVVTDEGVRYTIWKPQGLEIQVDRHSIERIPGGGFELKCTDRYKHENLLRVTEGGSRVVAFGYIARLTVGCLHRRDLGSMPALSIGTYAGGIKPSGETYPDWTLEVGPVVSVEWHVHKKGGN